MKRPLRLLLLVGSALLVSGARAGAQQLITKGMYGMKAGAMAPPGLYAGAFGSISWADELKTGSGETIHGPKLTQEIFGPLLTWVSPYKILGANYAATVAIPFANGRVEFPRLNDQAVSTGVALSQLWVVPFALGWHLTDPLPLSPGGMDITFDYSFYAPTGPYEPGAPDNTSLGMWTNELSLRSTAYFDKARQWHGTASLFYDFNGKKEGEDWTTGNPFTYMWGLGRDYGDPHGLFSGWAGLAGYAQWQVTSTTGADAPAIAKANKTTIYAIGPEFTTLGGALTARYFWQFGGKFSTEGQGLYVQFALPVGN